jgi:predicted  nucleic acid-binding Zn-ribbon protein
MPNKREMNQEIETLRERLRKNENLLMAASIKAEDLMALEDKHDVMKGQSQRLKRIRK